MTDEKAGLFAARFAAWEPRVTEGLRLAAAPTFAIMALVTGIAGGAPDMLCGGGQATFSLSGMAPMYLLMSTFHVTPWLRLLTSRDLH